MDISKQYDLPFSVETVYDAWIFSETLIPPATRLDITPKVGGEISLWIETAQLNARMRGVFKVIIPYQKLIYSWEWNQDGEETEVTVEFSKLEKGTRVNISHTGWRKEESRKTHEAGWDSYIQGLIDYLNYQN